MGTIAEFSIAKARKAQDYMAQKVITQDQLPKEIRLVAGVDAAYTEDLAIGATATLDYESLEVLETKTATQQVRFPYVPTLLSFRELPVAISAIWKLKLQPDVFLVDGHGRAHPYRCGLASHLGLALGKPTVGVAKSRLIGEAKQIGEEMFLIHKDEAVAAVVPTFEDAGPVYVSVGHMVSLKTAVEVVKHCIRGSRMPEPIKIAHSVASGERKAKIAQATSIGVGNALC